MADPVLPNGIRALCVLQNANGLPADRYVTTWAFACTSFNAATHPQAIRTAIANFFNLPAGTANVAAHIGAQASRAVLGSKVISYELGQASPRTPHSQTWTLGAIDIAGGVMAYPAEVAACASFKSDDKPGPRGKGRVYIGPLNSKSAGGEQEASEPRPGTGFRLALNNAMKALAESSVLADAGLSWSILSQADAALYEVTGGWVDNAFDTQRRRGLVTSSRSTWVKA